MKKQTTILVCALAVLAVLAGACEQSDDGNDWSEAEKNVGDGEIWEVPLDDGQSLLWSQPATAFVAGDESSDELRTVYITPEDLKFCHNDSCSSYTEFTGFSYGGSPARGTRLYYAIGTGPISNVDRIFAQGTSSSTDYCNVDYSGWYNDLEEAQPSWKTPTEADFCDNSSPYTYYIDEETDLDDWTYEFDYVARWKYKIDGYVNHTILSYQYVEE